MKNHSFKVEILIFSSILLLFIVPPFFAPKVNEGAYLFQNWTFPFQQLVYGLLAGIIFFSLKEQEKKNIFFRFPVILITGLLFCSSLIMKFVSVLIFGDSESSAVILPDGFVQWLFCILTFLPAAFFEEVIYRFYFPDALTKIVTKKFDNRWLIIICEIASCLIFALAHYYLGWLSVANAIFGHIILRVSYKKNKSLWPGIAAHFIYNVMSLILL